jgi:hypothetical protein
MAMNVVPRLVLDDAWRDHEENTHLIYVFVTDLYHRCSGSDWWTESRVSISGKPDYYVSVVILVHRRSEIDDEIYRGGVQVQGRFRVSHGPARSLTWRLIETCTLAVLVVLGKFSVQASSAAIKKRISLLKREVAGVDWRAIGAARVDGSYWTCSSWDYANSIT